MQVVLAYWSVVFIWSTTPLAISVSNQGLSFWTAAGLRMLLAFIVVSLIIVVRRQPLMLSRQALMAYAVSAIGLSPQMSLVYWAAQHVPSGVVALMFAFTPCLTALASLLILRDSRLSARQITALALAILGMAIIYLDQLSISRESALGLVALFVSTAIFAVSSVCLKRVTDEGKVNLDPFCQTGGTLLFALPIYFVVWSYFDGEVPAAIEFSNAAAIIYLAVMGSVAGFTLYFYILQRMSVMTVSLITLMTPVVAMGIGTVFLGEALTLRLVLGAVTVLLSLFLFEGRGVQALRRRLASRAVVNRPDHQEGDNESSALPPRPEESRDECRNPRADAGA